MTPVHSIQLLKLLEKINKNLKRIADYVEREETSKHDLDCKCGEC